MKKLAQKIRDGIETLLEECEKRDLPTDFVIERWSLYDEAKAHFPGDTEDDMPGLFNPATIPDFVDYIMAQPTIEERAAQLANKAADWQKMIESEWTEGV